MYQDKLKRQAMSTMIMPRLTGADVDKLDPYAFMAVISKRVIHPGGRHSTEELLQRADVRPDQHVLDVGCSVGTTSIQIARRFGACVTAVDLSHLMLDRARANVRMAKVEDRVTVESGDVTRLQFPDATFDRVIAEAVTMFVDRPRAAKELVRVCKPGGRLLTTEFLWRKPPTPEARHVFMIEVCPGMMFDTLDDWLEIYRVAGLEDIQVTTGPFEMMTPGGFLRDEGLMNCLAIMGRTLSRWSYIKKMAWLMPRVNRAVPYLGYITVSGMKSRHTGMRAS
jgi:SAM-dependent methyltransferase